MAEKNYVVVHFQDHPVITHVTTVDNSLPVHLVEHWWKYARGKNHFLNKIYVLGIKILQSNLKHRGVNKFSSKNLFLLFFQKQFLTNSKVFVFTMPNINHCRECCAIHIRNFIHIQTLTLIKFTAGAFLLFQLYFEP